MGALNDFFHWFFNHIGFISLFFVMVWKGKMIWTSFVSQPLKGGNGVVQMDELAKYIMMVLLVYMVIVEGQGPEQVYPETVFWAMVVGAFLIAGVKEFAHVLKPLDKK